VVDPLFPPDNPPEERVNDYELIYCTHHSKFSQKPINVRQDFNTSLYPIKALEPGCNPSKR
jgi:hypothetical protein